MFCEPNLKNRDNIEAIKKSVSLPDTCHAEAAAFVEPVRTGRGCLPQEPAKGQKICVEGVNGFTLLIPNSRRFVARASCAKVGTGFAHKTMRQQKPGARCVIHKSRILL
jgi:hypothetical protein